MTRTGRTFHKPIRATKTWEELNCDGVGFGVYWDSLAEKQYFYHCLLAGTTWPLRHIIIKPKPIEIEGGTYRPDFFVTPTVNKRLASVGYYIEVKGSETPMWRRTKKQLRERYPNLRLLIVFGRADKKRGFVTTSQSWLNPESEG